ncbi:MAG: AAA family ATP:ADP antiporter, partial [Candidatus Krumholzibacteriia bacterium]
MNTATKPLDRLLRVFAPVKGGEGSTVLIMASNVFLLMTAYYIVKPVREALILADWGAEAKIYASAGQAILLLGVVPLYSRLAGMMNTRRLISTVLIFFASCLVLFYVLAQFGLNLGLAFYLWVGIFNVMVVAQFWSFANDFYTPEEGKRLFALIGFG